MVNTSDLQTSYLVNSRFVVGMSNDAVRRQYIVEVRSKWRSGTPFGFDTFVETIAEAYMAAGHDGCANFDLNNVSFPSHANATHQPHANSECSSNAVDRARADEP